MKKKPKQKKPPDSPKIESGLVQMKMIGKSIRQTWVNKGNLLNHRQFQLHRGDKHFHAALLDFNRKMFRPRSRTPLWNQAANTSNYRRKKKQNKKTTTTNKQQQKTYQYAST